jgi:amino acid adenylation domain-containing protein
VLRETTHGILSFSQERLWFLDQFVQAPAHNIAVRVRLRGPLRHDALGSAFAEAVARYDALAVAIRSDGGKAMASTSAAPTDVLPVTNLVDLPTAERDERVAALSRDQAARRFDLAAGPLIRAELLRLAADEHLLLVAAHRAAADLSSLDRLLARMADEYRARLAGRPLDAPAPPGFADFAAAERAATNDPTFAGTAEAWRAHLADVPLIELPTDRVRAVQPHYDADAVRRELPASVIAQARDLADRLGRPVGDVLRAAFQALLHRYTGHEVLAVGTVPMRDDRWRAVVGPVDTLAVVRSEAAGDTSLTDLVTGGAAAPPAIPFEKLVEALDPPRDPTRSPVVQVVVSVIDAAAVETFGDVTVEDRYFETSGATLHDLDVLLQTGPAARVDAVFRTDLYNRPTMERMLAHYEQVLRAALAEPQAPIHSLDYLDAAERHRILEEFNDTDAPFPRDATVQELFEAQMLRTPDARAVTLEGNHLTYRELNARANRLAHFLRGQGVGRGRLVGICLERSLDFVVAVLGVLKSGGAYVPLDPAYPADRLRFMLEDTRASIVLTQRKLRGTAPVDDSTTVIVLDDDSDRTAIGNHPADDPINVNAADDLTYIVYTSGSTGRPKGVETTHRGVVRLVINTDILELDEKTSYLQISPLSFDASTLEIFGPLLNGGRIVLLPPGIPTPAVVARTVREQGVDTLWLVAPLAHLTIDSHLDDLSGLRQFMAGGDVLSIPHVRTVLAKLPHVKMVNGYGPTEVTAFSVSYRITHVDPDWPSIPIGRPMSNTTAYILDERQQVVPVGVWGEMYLGGPGVAQGYHNRPELNAERFLPDTFRPGPGAQLYRTGDRCRWLPDGVIQFHGRFDTQVKLDGLRVELGEIQSVVAAYDSVGAAVVTAPYVGSRRSLVAYVVPVDRSTFDAERLRSHLSAILPGVMVPAHYVVLDTIPLTPNNKVDFQALPEPDLSGAAAHRPPQTPTQEALAEIWQQILGVGSIGIDDNFFYLGGHSLRAVPMIAAISARFGVELAVQDVFEGPVLGRLAERIEELMLAQISPDDLERLLGDVTDE